MLEDSQSCLALFKTHKYCFFQGHIERDKWIEIELVELAKQKANNNTKGLPEAQFQAIKQLLMVHELKDGCLHFV